VPDLVFLATLLLFFGAAAAYVRFCDRLTAGDGDPDRDHDREVRR
jgi:hypothetical protein